VLITETTHVSDYRSSWVRYVAEEAEALLKDGIPLRGICLYPILGMPEWHERDQWVTMGLWDIAPDDPGLARTLCQPMYEELRRAQRLDLYIPRRRMIAAQAS
jgi:hypothetical protein